ncbi:MAG: C4-type zinc ribbon domain-containing protein [Capsulimonas sp.]|uniref:zinc ribbon domain-containing protein n=1 Tax=Capsulimonas sp. TaxID=2494211 RepID=UPI0032658BBC
MPLLRETLEALLALQQIDTQIQRTRKTQAGLDNGAEARTKATAIRAQANASNQEYHKIAADLKDTELKLASVENKAKTNQQRMYQGAITNVKELANLEKEIESLGRQRSDLDGRVLELMEEAEAKKTAAELADAEAVQAEGHHQSTVAQYHSRFGTLGGELTELTAQRNEAAKQIEDKTLLKRYDDIRARAAGVGIARVVDRTCGGCHMQLGSQAINMALGGDDLAICENCGRMLTK